MSTDILALVAAMPAPKPSLMSRDTYTGEEVWAFDSDDIRSERLKAAQLVLAQGEPVAWYDGAKFYGSQEAASMACADMGSLMPLYASPAAPVNAEVLAALRALYRGCVQDGWPVYGAHLHDMVRARAAIASAEAASREAP